MNLVAYTATALSRNDITDTPTNKNVVDGAIVELKDLGGNLVVIYDDETGANPETQKTCDTNGQVTFFAEIGDYDLEINGKAQRINLSSGLASFISTKTGESVQGFIDTFVLKIFQSPTGGDLSEIQTRTVEAGEVYEVRRTSDDSLATIYSDAAGTTEIVQNGTSNVSGSDGVVEFYIVSGSYTIATGAGSSYFDINSTSEITTTLSVAEKENSKIGTRYKLADYAVGIYEVVSSTDTGGFYLGVMDNGNKLRLVFTDTVYVEWFGAKSGVDSATAHNLAAEYGRNLGVSVKSLAGVTYSVGSTVNFRSIRFIDYKSQLNGSGDFITMYLGGSSLDTQQFYVQKVYKVNRGGSSAAIRILGSNKNVIRIGEASIVEVYTDTDSSKSGTDEYCAYNDIYIQSCATLRWNSNPSTDGSAVQWINKNNFYLSFCQNFESINNGYKHNGNHIYGGNFEASTSYINMQAGIGNVFHDVRGENSLAITFGSNADNNVIITDWFDSPNNPVAGASITDNGINNCVKNQADLYNDRVTLLSFNGSSLTDNGAGLSNIMGVSPSLVKDAVNNTVTATANALIYTSPLIEINPSSEYFDIEVVPKLSGGIRMKIDGYASDMSEISNTGADVFYSGATNEVAGFGENSTTITNKADQRRIRVTNSLAKYIRITVNASSSGVSFRRMTLEATTGNKFGKKQLIASAMIPNIS